MGRWNRGVVLVLAKGGQGTDPRLVKRHKGRQNLDVVYPDTAPLPAVPGSEVLTVEQGAWKL